MLLNFGSAIMGPEVYLKALAMARNVARQEGRSIRHFTTAVFDLVPIHGDYRRELPKTDPGYYFRPHKTILVRTVADGGESFYFCGDHRATVPALWRALVESAADDHRRNSGRIPAAAGAGGGRRLPGPLVPLRSALADPSRETGIPRIAVVSTEVTPGAAGTVANNVAALGARVGSARAGRQRRLRPRTGGRARRAGHRERSAVSDRARFAPSPTPS